MMGRAEATAAIGHADESAVVDLRYIARAGLLPELSGQTYDAFHKALREAILNGADADASQIEIDLTQVVESGRLVVRDDGVGMSLRDLCDRFMSLGGSARYADSTRYGRIGIGSLALLQYGSAAVVETKCEGSRSFVRARLEHPWRLDGNARRQTLGDIPAGSAQELAYDGPPSDHFTRIMVDQIVPEVYEAAADPPALYELVETLRRILPLPWNDVPIWQRLHEIEPDMVVATQEHVGEWAAQVVIKTDWGEAIQVRRRSYGDATGGFEEISGAPWPIFKKVRVSDPEGSREILLAGYLASQRKPTAAWSGITVRVQNVAVELNSFFDVTSDPGFRKYITGEIFVSGMVDADRLINIDRCSFNRESRDYRAMRRYLADQITYFKTRHVQKPQNAKTVIRGALESYRGVLQSMQRVSDGAYETFGSVRHGGLPSSQVPALRGSRINPLRRAIRQSGVPVRLRQRSQSGPRDYFLDQGDGGEEIVATVNSALLKPSLRFGTVAYALRFLDCPGSDVAVTIRNRPREISINTAHPAHALDGPQYHVSLALEIAYVVSRGERDEALYAAMLDLVRHT